MSLLQLARCCSCAKAELPCNDCGTTRCICDGETQEGDSGVVGSNVPITSIHIEVSGMSTRQFRSESTKDSSAWHYMNDKRWRATEYGPRGGDPTRGTQAVVTRLVLDATSWMLGFRYGDKFTRVNEKIMTLVLPAGQWGKRPEQGLNSRKAKCACITEPLPCTDMVVCCFCNIPGSPHDAVVTWRDDCVKEGGVILGDADNTDLDVCNSFCENQAAGYANSRLGELIADPLRHAKEYVSKRLRLGRKALQWKYLLRQTASETATYPVILPEGAIDKISKEEQNKFDKSEMLPVSHSIAGLMPRYLGRGLDDPTQTDGDCGPCIGNACSQTGPFWDEYANAYDQRRSGVYNYVHPSGDCCGAKYAGVSYTIEMDWPCEETADAYVRAKQKYDFGRAAFAEAQRYCANEGQGTEECGGGGFIDQPELCHPLAEELIGGNPPNLVPCIKTCPLQKAPSVCREGYRRWPQGDFVPDGENVLQTIPCVGGADVFDPNEGIPLPEDVQPVEVTPTNEMGCTFKTNPVSRNYSSIANCGDHQCGALAACGGQYCCRVEDCIEYDCCEQLLTNPATGETVQYNDDGCIVDDEGRPIGGWRTYPDDDGTYFRCPRQEDTITGVDEFNNPYTICPGCTEQRPFETVCADCGPSNSQITSCRTFGNQCNPAGDILNWTIPRKIEGVGQGNYPRHCPDHLEPFTLNGQNRIGSEVCDRKRNPSIGDPGFCWYDDRNPTGTFCDGGFCTYYNTQTQAIGTPYHLWPVEDIRFTNCQGQHVGQKGPCEKQWEFCADGGPLPPFIEPDVPGQPPPTSPSGFMGGDIGGGGDDCDFYCLEDGFEKFGHLAAACGATPCDDKVLFKNVETGQVVEDEGFGPPDNSGNWRVGICKRCVFDGLGRRTRNNLGCQGDPCEGVRGYNSNLIAFRDGFTEEEMGLQLISISCAPQNQRAFERDGVGRTDRCSGEFRNEYGAEKHFQVYLEYKGGGAGYAEPGGARSSCTREGQGFFTLAKSIDAPSTCIFGTYKDLIGKNDGWFSAGGSKPAPFWAKGNPGRSYYYQNELAFDDEGRPDCSRRIWRRPNNNFGCKFSNPRVIIL